MKLKFVFIFTFLFTFIGFAQNDTIQLINDDVLIGEIKTFSRGVLVMETSYSDKDFKIEFNKVKSLVIQRKCLVILTKGRRRFGNIITGADGLVIITLEDGTKERFDLEEIVALNEVDDVFFNRFTGSIDFGFSLSKANSYTQIIIGGDLNYVDERWMVNGNLSVLNSSQENVEKTKRTDAELKSYRLLPQEWFLLGNISFLANTEQALDGRLSPSVGFGKFLISTNKLHLGLSLGYAFNMENYVDTALNKTSSEAFVTASFNMFDFEDIDLDTNINFYPSLSENGRVRTDYDLNLKYDLPLNLYIKLGYTLNFDNQPAIGGNDIDYLFTSGFGWDFD